MLKTRIRLVMTGQAVGFDNKRKGIEKGKKWNRNGFLLPIWKRLD